jgi:hypothetical protein
VRVDVGYFLDGGPGRGQASAGTKAALIGGFTAPSFAWRDGRIVTEPARRRVGRFRVGDKRLHGLSTGASEHFTLPRSFPQLEEVGVYLGWFGPLTRLVQAASVVSALIWRRSQSPRVFESLASRVQGSRGGPGEMERESVGSLVCGAAYDGAGRQLSQAVLSGVNPYTFTAEILAWGARCASGGEKLGAGALGPVDAFGLDELTAGCASAGLRAST